MAEYSPHTTPVYWRFLAGGPERLCLSLPALAAVVVVGPILLGLAGAVSTFGDAAGPATCWPSVAAATFSAWLVAALAARWLGSRLGALAGLVHLTSIHLLLPARASAAEMLSCAAVSAAMGAFALANVPGRLPLVDRRWTSWAFYAAAGVSFVLAGPLGPALILTGCGLYLALSADSRGLPFFASPVGIAVFLLIVGVRLAEPEGLQGVWAPPSGIAEGGPGPGASLPGMLRWLAVAALPWTPLVVLAAGIGLRQGHYATPIWRFFACWAVGPLALAAVGAFRSPSQLGPLLPPLAVMSAAGLSGLLVWCRRGWRPPGRRTGDR